MLIESVYLGDRKTSGLQHSEIFRVSHIFSHLHSMNQMKFVLGSFTVIISAARSRVFHIFSDFSSLYPQSSGCLFAYLLGRQGAWNPFQTAATKISSLLDQTQERSGVSWSLALQQCTTELHPKLVCLDGSLMIFMACCVGTFQPDILRSNIPTALWAPLAACAAEVVMARLPCQATHAWRNTERKMGHWSSFFLTSKFGYLPWTGQKNARKMGGLSKNAFNGKEKHAKFKVWALVFCQELHAPIWPPFSPSIRYHKWPVATPNMTGQRGQTGRASHELPGGSLSLQNHAWPGMEHHQFFALQETPDQRLIKVGGDVLKMMLTGSNGWVFMAPSLLSWLMKAVLVHGLYVDPVESCTKTKPQSIIIIHIYPYSSIRLRGFSWSDNGVETCQSWRTGSAPQQRADPSLEFSSKGRLSPRLYVTQSRSKPGKCGPWQTKVKVCIMDVAFNATLDDEPPWHLRGSSKVNGFDARLIGWQNWSSSIFINLNLLSDGRSQILILKGPYPYHLHIQNQSPAIFKSAQRLRSMRGTDFRWGRAIWKSLALVPDRHLLTMSHAATRLWLS